MEKLIVIGGKRLKGSVRVSGAKNAILPILAASLLSEGVSIIHEVPRLLDVQVMKDLLLYLGAKIESDGSTLMIDGCKVQPLEIAEDLMRKMRASNLVMGAMLGRFGKVKVAYPGGCAIGSRPMDLHMKGFISLGAKITEKHGYVIAETDGLQGAEIQLDFPSVGATENLMMAATQATGRTVLRNSAREPEIVDLQNFLNGMGASIRGAGTDLIKIDGPTRLYSTKHTVIPDRIEVGTHLIAGTVTGGDITVENVIPEHVEAVIFKLKEAGAMIEVGENSIRVVGPPRIKSVDIKTLPYPGFPTDMQAQMMVLMALAEGTGVVSEAVFENRYKHVDELRRMGADIKIEGRVAVVKGIQKLSGTFVEATDLRAGAALLIAGLVAEDATVIENVWHIDRGYENIERKYMALGARVMRVNGI